MTQAGSMPRPGSMPGHFDCQSAAFKAPICFCNGDRVHISYGSAQSICKVVPDCDEIKRGEEAHALAPV